MILIKTPVLNCSQGLGGRRVYGEGGFPRDFIVGEATSAEPSRPNLLESGSDIRTIQELLGQTSVETTTIYTHVLNRGPLGVRGPVDQMNLGPGNFRDEARET